MQVERVENTAVMMERYRALLAQGDTLPVPVVGNSMAPFLVHLRDTVLVAAPVRPLKTGDIVLYQRDSGAYILHRICAVQGESFTLIGDAHTVREPGIRRDQIFGVVVSAQRKGREQTPGCFWWDFFACVWPRVIAFRPAMLRTYSILIKLFRRPYESFR